MSPCFTKASLLWALIFSCHPRILINSAGKLKPIPSPADLPDPGIKPGSPAWQADSLPAELPGTLQTGWLVNSTNLFPGVLEAGNPSLRCPENCSLMMIHLLVLAVSGGRDEAPLWGLFYKDSALAT